MTDQFCDITPSTELLIAWRSQNLTRAHVLGELIDNSFDWGSNTVTIEYTGKNLIISDDGEGCGDLANMLTAGNSARGGKVRVGRFGVGLKDSAIWLGGITQIRSVNRGIVRAVNADWDAIARSHQWRIPVPREDKAEAGDRGTRITFAGITRDMPSGKNLDTLIAEIGYLFTPAIKAGKQIVFRFKGRPPISAPRFTLPKLEHEVDVDIFVDSKRAHVHVGVVPADAPTNPRPGISYTHLHRVIIPACGLGCGGRGYSRISGWVSLDGGWTLNKNKDGVNVDEDALGDAVFGAIKDVVERASRQSMSIKSAAIANNLTSMLRAAFATGDAQRDRTGEKPGSVTPKNSGRRHAKTNKGRIGASRLWRKTVDVGSLSVEFKPFEDPLIGSVDLKGPTVWLSDNHRRIVQLREQENLDALLAVAFALLAEVSRHPDNQRSFRFGEDPSEISFENAFGRLFREHKEPDSKLKVVA